jgi:hypothetical protein
MNMPGFNAQAALYRSGRGYYRARTDAIAGAHASVGLATILSGVCDFNVRYSCADVRIRSEQLLQLLCRKRTLPGATYTCSGRIVPGDWGRSRRRQPRGRARHGNAI